MKKIFAFIKNLFINKDYDLLNQAIIISPYYNSQKNPHRLKAFKNFYDGIKCFNHAIIELSINGSEYQLENIVSRHNLVKEKTDSLLWHKETLLNKLITEHNLLNRYKYIFWVDGDVLFENKNWLIESLYQMRDNDINIIQPFEYCVHGVENQNKLTLEQRTTIDLNYEYINSFDKKIMRSFGATYSKFKYSLAKHDNYHVYGHVGFAWGIKSDVLKETLFFDKALIGGADHIMAKSAIGEWNHKNIITNFSDIKNDIQEFGVKFYGNCQGKLGYTKGNLLHLYHGDVEKREYVKRFQDFNQEIPNLEKSKDGFYKGNNKTENYFKSYFNKREVDCDFPTSEVNDVVESLVIDTLIELVDNEVNDVSENNSFDGFGGGDFGGGGAEGIYDDYSDSGNFS